MQAVADFHKDARRRLFVVAVELQRSEERYQFVHRHLNKFRYVASSDPYIERFLAQARAPAFRTEGLARVAGFHHPELDFPPFGIYVVEKFVQSVEMFVAAPQQAFLFRRQRMERRVNRESELRSVLHQFFFPAAHRLAAPAGDGVFVDGLALVRNDQVFVDAHHFAVAFAAGTGSQRVVEAEQVFGRRLEFDAVGLEARRVVFLAVFARHYADAIAVGECAGHRIADPGRRVIVGRQPQAVYDDLECFGFRVGSYGGQHFFDQSRFAPGPHAHQAVREQQRHLLDEPLPRRQPDGRRYDDSAPLLFGKNAGRHVVHAVTAHFLPRYGRVGAADAGEQQFQIVVDFGRRPDRRAGVARVDFLFDGNGRGDARYQVYVGFAHLAQELSRVGRKALHIAALSLGEYRVESQRRFSRARKSRHHYQFVVRYFDVDVLQVVDPGSFYIYAVFVSHGE